MGGYTRSQRCMVATHMVEEQVLASSMKIRLAISKAHQRLLLTLTRKVWTYIGRVSYIRISMLFLFPVKYGKLSTGVNATLNASCYG